MNNFFPLNNNPVSYTSMTALKSNDAWTPYKHTSYGNTNTCNDNDTTFCLTMPRNINQSTPISHKSPRELSLHTPIKKSKKRDCTPDSPDKSNILDFTYSKVYSNRLNEDDNLIINLSEKEFDKGVKGENINIYNNPIDYDNSNDIIDKIRGSYLLNILEKNNNSSIYKILLEDNVLLNKLINIMCNKFFDGFNNRDQNEFLFFLVKILF